jgi:hypothetical protein
LYRSNDSHTVKTPQLQAASISPAIRSRPRERVFGAVGVRGFAA